MYRLKTVAVNTRWQEGNGCDSEEEQVSSESQMESVLIPVLQLPQCVTSLGSLSYLLKNGNNSKCLTIFPISYDHCEN